ncbi:NADP-dependent oxidoreductase [Spirillospora sp. CA-294931]|uniref:NADP-dependent oxidoreductase n=1 Tax=Spirillospora sp. CA-294931 TaxID=3240042 RepID=UPI003D8F3375
MRAISQDVLGGPEVLREIDIDRPTPGPAEVLVRVHAAGLNPTDWKHRATGGLLGDPPFILGWDVSGTVEEVGLGVTFHAPGDEVFGMLPYPNGAGAYAEYVKAPSRTFVKKPANIDHIQAAALPLAALTAYQSLEAANLQPGQRVLIHAAAGGVGHLAVQLAKSKGAHVIGTASQAKHAFLKSLGADELIDYKTTDFAETLKDIDLVIDGIGGDYGPRSLKTLAPTGTLVSLVLSNLADLPPTKTLELLVEQDRAHLEEIAALAATGRLKAEIAAVHPLAEAAKAHHQGESNRTTGKLVLTP